MKKVVSVLLVVLLLTALAGCGGGRSKSLSEEGAEVVAMMTEMAASEPYLDAVSGSQELKDLVLGVGSGTPEKPEVVYEVVVDEKAALQRLNLIDLEDFSETLQQALRSRIYAAAASQVNASEGAAALAASSVCTASRVFKNKDLSGNRLFLYLYRDGAPALVTFVPNGDGVVTATGSFLLKDWSNLDKGVAAAWFEPWGGELRAVAGG